MCCSTMSLAHTQSLMLAVAHAHHLRAQMPSSQTDVRAEVRRIGSTDCSLTKATLKARHVPLCTYNNQDLGHEW